MGLKKTFNRVRDEASSFSKWEVLFIICAMVCSFFISCEASIIKPVANSLFLRDYGVRWLPLVWLTIIPFNFVVVHLYNKLLPKSGPFRVLATSTIASACINIFCSQYLDQIWYLPFLLYIWKDIYIMLMFHQLWSVIHSTVNLSRARYLYGIFYAVGGTGSAIGCTIPGFFAIQYGSQYLLLATLIPLSVLTLFYFLCLRVRAAHPHNEQIAFSSERSHFFRGVELINRSSMLKFILVIVVLMQMTATLVDFHFNTLVEATYSDVDVRTEYLGRFFGIINTVNIFLQLIGTFVLLKLFGLARSHLFIPSYLSLTSIAALINPSFGAVAFSFGSMKSLDYSIFGIIKEMLFIPLKLDEKFKAKAVIDIFAARTAKALASLFILALELIYAPLLNTLISYGVLLFFVTWAVLVAYMFRRPETRTLYS